MIIGISSYKIMENDGQGRINLEIIKSLANKGFKLAVFTTTLPNLQGSVVFGTPRIPKLPRLIQNYIFAFLANRFFKKIKPDIIIGNGYSLNLNHNINICHFVHGAYLKILPTLNFSNPINKAYQYIYTLINSHIEKKVFSRAGHIIAISQTLKQDLIAIGVPSEKISVIYNMLSKDSVLNINKKNKRKILFAGDFSNNRKNLQTVIEAMTMINGKLTICGKGNTKYYKKIANKFGVSKKVIFKGFVYDLNKILTENDILVLPSLYEGLPVVILESLNNSIPVLISKKCGLTQKQLMEAGIILKNETNPKEIADSCNKIFGSYTTYAKNAEKFSKKNNVYIMTKQYLNIIKKIQLVNSKYYALQDKYYLENAQNYDNFYKKDEEFPLAYHLMEMFLKKERAIKILDIGSGTGRTFEYFKNSRYKITGIEPCEHMRQIALKKGISNKLIINAHGENLPFKDNSFDLSCALGVLHHAEFPEKIVQEMLRVAKKGILIGDDNFYAAENFLKFWIKKWLKKFGLIDLFFFVKTKGSGNKFSRNDGPTKYFSVVDLAVKLNKQGYELYMFPMDKFNGGFENYLHVAIYVKKK